MRHEVIPKTLFVPFSHKLTLWRPFALIPVSNSDRDAIPNQNSALLYKYIGSLFGFLRFAQRGYHLNCVMSCCRQLFGGEPQEEGYDVDSSKFPLNNLPKVIEPVGLGWHQKSVHSTAEWCR